MVLQNLYPLHFRNFSKYLPFTGVLKHINRVHGTFQRFWKSSLNLFYYAQHAKCHWDRWRRHLMYTKLSLPQRADAPGHHFPKSHLVSKHLCIRLPFLGVFEGKTFPYLHIHIFVQYYDLVFRNIFQEISVLQCFDVLVWKSICLVWQYAMIISYDTIEPFNLLWNDFADRKKDVI